MTDSYVTADRVAWASALSEYQTSSAAFANLPNWSDRPVLDAICETLIKVEEALLELPAPDLPAVIQKLEIMWGEETLQGDTQESMCRLGVLGDLSRIDHLSGRWRPL